MRRFRVWRHRRKMNHAAEIDKLNEKAGRLLDQVYYLEENMDEAFSILFEYRLLIHELSRVDVNDLLQRVQELESRATAEEIVHYNESYERI